MITMLHCSDLHIGATLGGMDRSEEHARVLREISEDATHVGADVVLITGDVFDRPDPSPKSERIAFEFLWSLDSVAPTYERREVVIIPGNHDSVPRWRAWAQIWGMRHVTVVTEPTNVVLGEHLEPMVITAIPWLHPRQFVGADALLDGQQFETFGDGLAALVTKVAADPDLPTEVPRVLAMHATINGGRVGVGERPLHITETYAVESMALPPVNYLALGHLHRRQEVETVKGVGWYAGSVIKCDFGEADGIPPSVNVVRLAGDTSEVEVIDLETAVRLADVHVDWPGGALPEDPDVLIRLYATVEQNYPGLVGELRDAYPMAVQVHLLTPDTEPAVDDRQMSERSVFEQFEFYYAREHGEAMPPRHHAYLESIMEEAGL